MVKISPNKFLFRNLMTAPGSSGGRGECSEYSLRHRQGPRRKQYETRQRELPPGRFRGEAFLLCEEGQVALNSSRETARRALAARRRGAVPASTLAPAARVTDEENRFNYHSVPRRGAPPRAAAAPGGVLSSGGCSVPAGWLGSRGRRPAARSPMCHPHQISTGRGFCKEHVSRS